MNESSNYEFNNEDLCKSCHQFIVEYSEERHRCFNCDDYICFNCHAYEISAGMIPHCIECYQTNICAYYMNTNQCLNSQESELFFNHPAYIRSIIKIIECHTGCQYLPPLVVHTIMSFVFTPVDKDYFQFNFNIM